MHQPETEEHRQVATLLAALREAARIMTGSEIYESNWANYPEKPERSTADIVRGAIAAHTQVATFPNPSP